MLIALRRGCVRFCLVEFVFAFMEDQVDKFHSISLVQGCVGYI